MNKAEKEILLQFDTKLKTRYAKQMPTVPELIEDVKRRRIPLASYDTRPTKSDLEFVKQATVILKAIGQIVDNPNTQAVRQTVITPTSNARSVDGRSLARTMRDSSLWIRNEIGEMEPERVYANVNDDSLDTYENCFVKQLIDKVLEIIVKKVQISYDRMSSVEKLSCSASQNTDIFSAVSTLTGGTFGKLSLLSKDDDKGIEYIASLNKLRERYSRLQRTPFYDNVKRGTVNIANVVRTSEMITDPRYKQCYDFYTSHIASVNSLDVDEQFYSDCYYNYVLLRIMALFSKLKYVYTRDAELPEIKVRKSNADNKLRVAKIVYNYKAFEVAIVAKPHGIYIETKYLSKDIKRVDNHNKQIKNRLFLFVSDQAFTTKAQIEKAMTKAQVDAGEKIICKNCLFVAPDMSISNPNLVLTVSPILQYTNNKLDDFGKTLTLFVPASPRIYAKKCPICGENLVTHNEDCISCDVCSATWSVFVKKESEKGVVFIKRLGGDNYYKNKIKDLRKTRKALRELKAQHEQLQQSLIPQTEQ